MAEKSLFFNSAPGDLRTYQASDFADYFSNVLNSGLHHVDGVPALKVNCDGTGLRTFVEPGKAILQGYGYENTSNLYLTHALPESTLDRIDRIVLRLDKRNQSRFIKLFILQGVAAASPVAPALQRDEFIYELSLAQIRVRANTSTLAPADLIDERLDPLLCGLVEIQNPGFYTMAETDTLDDQAEANMMNWVKSFGLAGNAVSPPNNDLSAIVDTGAYVIGVSANAPFDYGSVFHIRRNNDATQLAISSSASAISMYIRKKSGAGAWSAWLPINAEGITVITPIDGLTAGTSYPKGVTTFSVDNLPEVANYPHPYGTVLTDKINDNRMSQMFFKHGGSATEVGMYFRHYHPNQPGWSQWFKVKTGSTYVEATMASVQVIATGTSTKLTGFTENEDENGDFNPTSGTFTAPEDGKYMFHADFGLSTTASGKYYEAYVWRTGRLAKINYLKPYGAGTNRLVGGTIMRLAKTETVGFYVFHDHGSNVAVDGMVRITKV